MQYDEKSSIYGVGIVESNVLQNEDTPGVVDMKMLNDTPGCVGINAHCNETKQRVEKAETVRVFEDREKEDVRKEIQKKFKKSLKKVLRFSGIWNIMQRMSAKGMKWQIAHWPVR